MRYLLQFLNTIADLPLAWFTPLWRRRGHEAATLLTRYINHYRPSLPEERRAELRATKDALKEALIYWRKDEVRQLTQRIHTQYAELPGFRRHWVVEFVESFFVIAVVFLGLRTYFVQPFRIPTNSMWPSLNGIVIHPVEEIPSLPKRVWDTITLGSSYVDVTADKAKQIVRISQDRQFLLFTITKLHFDDNSSVTIPAAAGAVTDYLRRQGKLTTLGGRRMYLPYKPGETIIRARVDAGDMVLVNRMSYHFRRPRRGETFVFDTRGLNATNSQLQDQSEGTHYIKRLVGLPGDKINIATPYLLINGDVAKEPGIARVAARQAPYNDTGYVALDPRLTPTAYLTRGQKVQLSTSVPSKPWLREYMAMGDNTLNSLDSRYWGPVHQFNVLGPASFTLWPFTWHWGAID